MSEKIMEILAKYTEYPRENMTKETSLITALAINSLDYVKAIMDIEDTFDIEIPESIIGTISTIGELAEYVEELAE